MCWGNRPKSKRRVLGVYGGIPPTFSPPLQGQFPVNGIGANLMHPEPPVKTGNGKPFFVDQPSGDLPGNAFLLAIIREQNFGVAMLTWGKFIGTLAENAVFVGASPLACTAFVVKHENCQ